MDPYIVMLASLISTMIGLIFVEVRRIRKKLEQRSPEASAAKPVSQP